MSEGVLRLIIEEEVSVEYHTFSLLEGSCKTGFHQDSLTPGLLMLTY